MDALAMKLLLFLAGLLLVSQAASAEDLYADSGEPSVCFFVWWGQSDQIPQSEKDHFKATVIPNLWPIGKTVLKKPLFAKEVQNSTAPLLTKRETSASW